MEKTNMIMIDFDRYNSIPADLIQYVKDNKKDFIKGKEKHPIDRYNLCASLNESIIYRHQYYISDILQETCIIAGHYSRVYNLNSIKENGLTILNGEKHFNNILSILRENSFRNDDEETRLNAVLNDIANHSSGDREGLVSLFYPVSKSEVFQHYSDSIGGEVIEIISDRIPNIYKILQDMGIPILVKAAVPFKTIKHYSKDVVINNIIRMALTDGGFMKKKDIRAFELISNKDIVPDNIINILCIEEAIRNT